jgi:hypothetical protein
MCKGQHKKLAQIGHWTQLLSDTVTSSWSSSADRQEMREVKWGFVCIPGSLYSAT